ncbi:MAG TPA: hypothetical protein VM582_01670 [Candidatus Thermoplasmatota archaeon]|nr:hypothetical protein [Candidatus Thermoplasmatota archaeon]
MRLDLRETGSIRVSARKEEVLEVLRRYVRDGDVRGDRVEARGNTYVVRESDGGTQIVHMRRESAPVAAASRDREALRKAVQADLYELRRVLELNRR